MKQYLRRYTSLMLGGGVLLLVLGALILVFRAIGLEKVPAIYLALLTLLAASVLLSRRYLNRASPKS